MGRIKYPVGVKIGRKSGRYFKPDFQAKKNRTSVYDRETKLFVVCCMQMLVTFWLLAMYR